MSNLEPELEAKLHCGSGSSLKFRLLTALSVHTCQTGGEKSWGAVPGAGLAGKRRGQTHLVESVS
jgi:hypothetical protein